MIKSTKQQSGIKAEELALKYLNQQGYSLLQKNFFCRYGELDLIMKNHDTIIFVEVRCRHKNNLCSPVESVNYSKITKIKKTAEFYLIHNEKLLAYMCRFDVIDIRHSHNTDNNYQINWITNAFD